MQEVSIYFTFWILILCFALQSEGLPMNNLYTSNSIIRGTFLEEGSLPLPILDMIRLAEKEGEIYIYDPTSHSSTAIPIRSIEKQEKDY